MLCIKILYIIKHLKNYKIFRDKFKEINLVILAVITAIYLVSVLSGIIFHSSYSEKSTFVFNTAVDSNSQIDINKHYKYNNTFKIVFPQYWNILDNENILLVSPDKMNPRTGATKSGILNVLITIQIIKISDFKSHSAEYDNSHKKNVCSVLSSDFNNINSAIAKKIFYTCPNNEKILNYIFATKDEIIFVGYKGIGSNYDKYLDTFIDTLKSIEIYGHIDAKKFTESYGIN